jgi:hypothetical protein
MDPDPSSGSPPSRSLAGKVAIVTGAGALGNGIGNGRASALLLAADGCTVIVSLFFVVHVYSILAKPFMYVFAFSLNAAELGVAYLRLSSNTLLPSSKLHTLAIIPQSTVLLPRAYTDICPLQNHH